MFLLIKVMTGATDWPTWVAKAEANITMGRIAAVPD
jgi:hypothetical protein